MMNHQPDLARLRQPAFMVAVAAGAALLVMLAGRGRGGVTVLEAPGREQVARISGNRAVLANGRLVTPVGRVIRTQSYGWGMAISPDETMAALVNRDAIEIMSLDGSRPPRRIPP